MPFASDKQRRYLWSQKPEVAKQIAYKKGGGPLSYEDPILLNALKKTMEGRVQQAKDRGWGVTHNYWDPEKYAKAYGEPFERDASPGAWHASTDYRPVPGQRNIYDARNVAIDVPLTPSLANAWVLGEEYAHADEMDKKGQHVNTLNKKNTPAKRYLEEMRAKAAADEFVGGRFTPEVQNFADYTRDSYKHWLKKEDEIYKDEKWMEALDKAAEKSAEQGRKDERRYAGKGKKKKAKSGGK